MVFMFIDNSTHHWKESRIHHIFKQSSAQAILSLPLATRQRDNKLIWVADLKGEFLAKSAYWIFN